MRIKNIAQNLIITTLLAVFALMGSASVFAETEGYTDSLPEETTQISSAYSIPANTERTLPEVDAADLEIPKAIGSLEEKDEPSLTAGFVMWIILGVIAAALLAVILTSKTKAYRSGGKKRYSTGNKMSAKTYLLNEKYYHKKRK